MVQLVGKSCARCSQRIATELSGKFCGECGSPVHDACAKPAPSDPDACPACGCGANLSEPAAPQSNREPMAESAQPLFKPPVSKGRQRALWVFGFLTVMASLSMFRHRGDGDDVGAWYDRTMWAIGVAGFLAVYFWPRKDTE
jgi:hypothetical protein